MSARGRFAVIGAGPVGCTLAAHLSAAGFEVTLCDMNPQLLAPAVEPGITVSGARELTGRVARVVDDVDELHHEPPEVIFVASKATSLPLIASSIQGFHREGMYVVSWQNGIDTERVLAEQLGKRWVMRAVVNYGVTLEAPGRVAMSFDHPPHWLQEMDPQSREAARELAGILTGAGLETSHCEPIVDMVWRKSILNSSMSPLCAVTGKTMGQVLGDPFLFDMVDNLLKEGIRVARANEIMLGWDYYRYCIDYLEGAGEHRPSMLVDVENGRRTEVDHINGRILEYAGHAGLEAPFNRMIRALVKAVEPC